MVLPNEQLHPEREGDDILYSHFYIKLRHFLKQFDGIELDEATEMKMKTLINALT